MKHFRLTIDAQIDDDLYQEMINDGYTDKEITGEVNARWRIENTPKPVCDAEVTDIKLVEG